MLKNGKVAKINVDMIYGQLLEKIPKAKVDSQIYANKFKNIEIGDRVKRTRSEGSYYKRADPSK